MKTPLTVYNVIILDKSGSMSSIARQAVDGVNETIGSIRSAQEKNPDQQHKVTLVAFCGCELKTIYDNTPVAEVRTLTDKDYRPCCMTPLYDAIVITISRVHDKEQGWQFTYIGADHDVESVSFSLSIDHHLQFDKTEVGTKVMFAKERKARNRWMGKVQELRQCCNESLASPMAKKGLKDLNKEEYFD